MFTKIDKSITNDDELSILIIESSHKAQLDNSQSSPGLYTVPYVCVHMYVQSSSTVHVYLIIYADGHLVTLSTEPSGCNSTTWQLTVHLYSTVPYVRT